MPQNPNFESSLKQLEEIVQKMEDPELEMDACLKFFEQGIGLARFCEKKLHEAEAKVEKLVQDQDAWKKEPFEA